MPIIAHLDCTLNQCKEPREGEREETAIMQSFVWFSFWGVWHRRIRWGLPSGNHPLVLCRYRHCSFGPYGISKMKLVHSSSFAPYGISEVKLVHSCSFVPYGITKIKFHLWKEQRIPHRQVGSSRPHPSWIRHGEVVKTCSPLHCQHLHSVAGRTYALSQLMFSASQIRIPVPLLF